MDEGWLERLIREAEAETAAPPPTGETAAPADRAPSAPDGAVPAEAGAASAPTAASPLVGLLKNPAVLSALPTLLSSTGGKGGTGGESKKKPDRHTALLCAIKPYLGRERQQTADQLISLCRLWDTLESTGLTRMLPTLLGGGGGVGGAAVPADGMSGDEPPKEG